MPAQISMPQQSDTMTEGTVVKWRVKEGERVKANQIVAEIERSTGRKAQVSLEPMPMGDMVASFTDIEPSRRDLRFDPVVPLDIGIPKFVAWYRAHYRL